MPILENFGKIPIIGRFGNFLEKYRVLWIFEGYISPYLLKMLTYSTIYFAVLSELAVSGFAAAPSFAHAALLLVADSQCFQVLSYVPHFILFS